MFHLYKKFFCFFILTLLLIHLSVPQHLKSRHVKMHGRVFTQGWAIPGSAHQYYTQYNTEQKLLSNTNTIPNLNCQSKLGTAQPQLV